MEIFHWSRLLRYTEVNHAAKFSSYFVLFTRAMCSFLQSCESEYYPVWFTSEIKSLIELKSQMKKELCI